MNTLSILYILAGVIFAIVAIFMMIRNIFNFRKKNERDFLDGRYKREQNYLSKANGK